VAWLVPKLLWRGVRVSLLTTVATGWWALSAWVGAFPACLFSYYGAPVGSCTCPRARRPLPECPAESKGGVCEDDGYCFMGRTRTVRLLLPFVLVAVGGMRDAPAIQHGQSPDISTPGVWGHTLLAWFVPRVALIPSLSRLVTPRRCPRRRGCPSKPARAAPTPANVVSPTFPTSTWGRSRRVRLPWRKPWPPACAWGVSRAAWLATST